MRAELLPPLSAGCADAATRRHVHVPPRFPLRVARLGGSNGWGSRFLGVVSLPVRHFRDVALEQVVQERSNEGDRRQATYVVSGRGDRAAYQIGRNGRVLLLGRPRAEDCVGLCGDGAGLTSCALKP